MNIPFVDLKAQYRSIKTDMDAAIQSVIDETAFVRGRFVKSFEEEYARAYGVKNCVSVANGTDAIFIVLKMLGIGPGDEVITTANSWIASSETITQAGARVVFCDTEADYFNIDPAKIEQKITKKTKALLAVHLLGQPAQMDRITEICRKHNLLLVEDCAQSHFSTFQGKRVGTFGIAATFSFYPGKNLGAYGDAGAIITRDDDVAKKCRTYANHGSMVKHEHEIEGINSRLDGLQAAVLLVKLPHIAEWNRLRAAAAAKYSERLAGLTHVKTPPTRPDCTHVFHVYCLRAQRRDDLAAHLKKRGVETTMHYPKALPFLKAYDYLGHKPDDFPVANQHQHEMLSLPIFPEITDEQIDYVCDAVREFYQ